MCPLCRNKKNKHHLILGLLIYQLTKGVIFLKASICTSHRPWQKKNVTRLPDCWEVQKGTSPREEKEHWPRNEMINVKRWQRSKEYGWRMQRVVRKTLRKGTGTAGGSNKMCIALTFEFLNTSLWFTVWSSQSETLQKIPYCYNEIKWITSCIWILI